MQRLIMHGALWLILQCFAAQSSLAEAKPPQCANVSAKTCLLAGGIAPGINLANIFEAPKEGDWGFTFQAWQAAELSKVFRSVRLPVRWSNNASLDISAEIDEKFFSRVERAVDLLLEGGLIVVLNVHNYSQITGRQLYQGEAEVDPTVVDERFINIWRQIATRFKNRSGRLIFEVYNEPVGRLAGAKWFNLQEKTLGVIRKIDRERTVVLTVDGWSVAKRLADLPEVMDPNILVTVHHYEPFSFTHQGATWVGREMPKGVRCCSEEQVKAIRGPLQTASAWSKAKGIPVFVGEFGVIKYADEDSRRSYLSVFSSEARSAGVPWMYWEMLSLFGLYDVQRMRWNQPLLKSLLEWPQ